MAKAYLPSDMPAVDDVIMQILGMSEARYDGAWIIGQWHFDTRRPFGWPMAKTVLAFYGFEDWSSLVNLHIGVDVITLTAHRQEQARDRVEYRRIIDEDRRTRGLHLKLSEQQRRVYAAMQQGMTTVPQFAKFIFGSEDRYARKSIHSALWAMRQRGVQMSVEGHRNSIFTLAHPDRVFA